MKTETAGSPPAAVACAAIFFDRVKNVRKGHTRYSSRKTLKLLVGRTVSEGYSSRPVCVQWNGKSGDDCVTTPLSRPVRSSVVVLPPPAKRPEGKPYKRENDGPTTDWRTTATTIWTALPANDSAIFARKADTTSPRHTADAERLAPLLKFAKARDKREPQPTSWLQPENDNDPEEGASIAANHERGHRAGPSPEWLQKQSGICIERQHAKLGGGGEIEFIPVDAEYGTYKDDAGKPRRIIVKVGKLCFSNGKQKEKGFKLENGVPVRANIRMPAGAILNYPDKPGALLGAEPDQAEIARSNEYWRRLMSYDRDAMACRLLEPVRFLSAGRRKKRKVLITHEEQLAMLGDPNEPRPPVTYCKPGLPCGSPRVGDSFLGGWISSTGGKRPMDRWEDAADEMVRQAEFQRWCVALPPEQQRALRLASKAANFTEVGEAFGKTGKAAEREGKKRVLAANDNLAEILKRAA